MTAPWALVIETAAPERLRLACETGLAAAAFDVPVLLALRGEAAELPLATCADALASLREWVDGDVLGPFREAPSDAADGPRKDGSTAVASEALQARIDGCAQVLRY